MFSIVRATRAGKVCGPALVFLLATLAGAQDPDCIDTQSRAIATGGTNGVNAVFAADLDGDGDVDVLTASANDDKITWFESDGATPPSFTERIVSSNADGATDVAAADLDFDGDVDVVSASNNDDKIAWYENDGRDPPRFLERSITTGARNASAVHLVDVDGDGDVDVVVASAGDDTIAIYESDLTQQLTGDDPPADPVPGFTQVVLADFARGASAVYAAEIYDDSEDPDDDDFREVLSASRTGNTIAWYEREIIVDEDTQEEILVWVEQVIDGNARGAAAVFAADLDGKNGIDVLSASGEDNKISWYESDGGSPPSFTKRVISADALGASSVFAADLDGDGDLDVLSTSRFDDKVAWYENLGQGNFGNPLTNQRIVTTGSPGPADAVAVDLDGDAAPGGNPDLDVLVVSSVAGTIAASDKVAWFENDGGTPPSFAVEREISGTAVAPEALLAVDVDGDGTDIDLVAASAVDDWLLWFENTGGDPPVFVEHVLSRDAPGAQELFWADLDGDLDMDLLVALADADSIAWYENLGGGDFGDPDTNRRNIALLSADGASSVFAADLDDDGDLDVLSASANDDKIAWYENLGGGDFGDPTDNQTVISSFALGASSVYAVDLDDDGDVDVLSASFDDDTIRWFEAELEEDAGEFTPVFTTRIISTDENGARQVLAAYVDLDTKLDIVSASSRDDSIVWFEQTEVDDGQGGTEVGFSSPRFITGTAGFADFVERIVARDMDNDGDLDIVSASSGDDKIAFWQSDLAQQNGADPPPEFPEDLLPVWTQRPISARSESARAVDVADLDGDGNLDVATGFLFEIAWHAGGAEEICLGFDATGDNEIDGLELSLLGGAFGQICADPGNPDEWWLGIDYNEDCQVDGDDLAILTAKGVWGRSTDPDDTERPVCAFTCP
jgi:hypothetical protein